MSIASYLANSQTAPTFAELGTAQLQLVFYNLGKFLFFFIVILLHFCHFVCFLGIFFLIQERVLPVAPIGE